LIIILEPFGIKSAVSNLGSESGYSLANFTEMHPKMLRIRGKPNSNTKANFPFLYVLIFLYKTALRLFLKLVSITP
jgi:hypothetical protein